MHIQCPSCGAVVPGSDSFCHRCGANFPPEELEEARRRMGSPACIRCGAELLEGASFCTVCGSAQDDRARRVAHNEIRGRLRMARMLALIPGIFNIYGLGHLLLGRWLRGLAFLACSAALFLGEEGLKRQGMLDGGWGVALMVLSLGIFVIQIWDVFKLSQQKERSLL